MMRVICHGGGSATDGVDEEEADEGDDDDGSCWLGEA